MAGEYFVGTSGFASPSARGSLSPQTRSAPDMLHAYGRRFRAVELDSCFVRAPSRATVAGWAEQAPGDFAFSVRVPREVTHVDRLGMPARVSGFVDVLAPIGDRLRCLLFTTPSTLGCEVDRFERLLDAVPAWLPTAWEFRHPSWSCPEVFDVLADRRSARVVVESHEGLAGGELLPGEADGEKWAFPFLYVRFRKEGYRPGELMAWGELLGEAIVRGQDVYAFFRQSPEAVAYATALSELLADAAGGAQRTYASAPREPEKAATKQRRISR